MALLRRLRVALFLPLLAAAAPSGAFEVRETPEGVTLLAETYRVDYRTKKTVEGGRWLKAWPAPLDALPLFVRDGMRVP